MIKNIVLDIGGVIFDDSDFNLSKLLNKDLEEIKKIAKVAYGGNFKKCLLGQMTVEQHILELQNIEVKNYNIIKYILSYENLKHSFPLMTSTIEVIQELIKRNYKIYLLSNITEASYKYICETIDMEKLFDGGLFSYEEQMVKPNKGFYEKLINKYNLIKEETIFFDDKEKNVIAANEIGIKAIQFKNVKDIYDNLDIDKRNDKNE